MVFISEDLAKMSTELQKELEFVGKTLKTLPKGRLTCEFQHGTFCFVKETYVKGRRIRRNLPPKAPELPGLIKRLVLEAEQTQLKANSSLLECATTGIDIDKRAVQKIKRNPEHGRELLQLMSAGVKDFDLSNTLYEIKDRFLQHKAVKNSSKNKEFIKNLDMLLANALQNENSDSWANEPYEKLQFQNDGTKWHITSFGLRVRSKSELMIAEILHKYNIPFRYEQMLRFDSSTLAPDFTIKRNDGKIMYWEHEGLTNSSEYLEHQLKKSQIYAMNNIVPWDNLIVTYDNAEGLIDMRIVESEIQNKILV